MSVLISDKLIELLQIVRCLKVSIARFKKISLKRL